MGGVTSFEGKVSVVTGAASGIGLALSEALAADGSAVVLADVEPEALAATTDRLAATGADVRAVPCDVRDPDQVDALRDATLEAFGGVHVVCLNAGVAPTGTLVDTTAETWRWLLDVNVLGVANGVRAFAPLLVGQGEGHVVCTASAAGLMSAPFLGAYSATKHAVVGLAAVLRDELAPSGVGVSVLCPGVVRTRIFESERNRPGELAGESHPDAALIEGYRGAAAAGVDPAGIARAVLDAVVDNRFLLVPTPDVHPFIEARLDEVRAAVHEQREAAVRVPS